ncbi:hypothetical protein D1007_26305 [Hordeum vulgare]|nr:hypothetical protein D1007_26305 [Hordeum vulgare]
MMALSAAGDVAIPEVKEEVHEEQPMVASPPELVAQRWTWSCTTTEMVQRVVVEPWCPTPPRSTEHESSPSGEVVQAPPAPPTFQGAPAHLSTMPPYDDLTGNDDDNDDA